MLRITRAANGEVLFELSGQMGAENIRELETLFGGEARGRLILLDLKDLTRVDQDIFNFLDCSDGRLTLLNSVEPTFFGKPTIQNRRDGPVIGPAFA